MAHATRRRTLVALLIVTSAMHLFANANELPRRLLAFTETELVGLGRNPTVVGALRERNAGGITLDRTQSIDAEWRATDGVSRFMLDLMSNDLALTLLNFEYEHPFIVETFVMDRFGGNVGLSARTSDYWQGDEAKFVESYSGGAGAIHYGEIEFDESSSEIVLQISVPVMDGSSAIGAITFSVSLDKWERR